MVMDSIRVVLREFVDVVKPFIIIVLLIVSYNGILLAGGNKNITNDTFNIIEPIPYNRSNMKFIIIVADNCVPCDTLVNNLRTSLVNNTIIVKDFESEYIRNKYFELANITHIYKLPVIFITYNNEPMMLIYGDVTSAIDYVNTIGVIDLLFSISLKYNVVDNDKILVIGDSREFVISGNKSERVISIFKEIENYDS